MTSENIALRFVKKRHDFLTKWHSKQIWLKIAAFFNGMEFLMTHAEGMVTGEIHVEAEAPAGVEPLEAWSPMTL